MSVEIRRTMSLAAAAAGVGRGERGVRMVAAAIGESQKVFEHLSKNIIVHSCSRWQSSAWASSASYTTPSPMVKPRMVVLIVIGGLLLVDAVIILCDELERRWAKKVQAEVWGVFARADSLLGLQPHLYPRHFFSRGGAAA